MMESFFSYNVDIAEIALWAFTLFFFALVFYLRREDRREGYPLEADTTGRLEDAGFIWYPEPKERITRTGEAVLVGHGVRDERPVAAKRLAVWPGAPLEPTGDAMTAGVGPGAYAERADEPEMTWHGDPKIAPLRALPDFSIEDTDPDPRNAEVIGADGEVAGVITDVWVDQGEQFARYYEVALPAAPAAPPLPGPDGAPAPAPVASPVRVLLPVAFADFKPSRGVVEVGAILAHQFADVPRTRHPDQVTLLEEDKISGYFAAGLLYATPMRAEALI